jgi:two-component system, OmpR family, sensor kinase
MNPLRSVGARLSLALAFVIAVALGIAYAIVVPSLERNLIEAKLDQLRRDADAQAFQFPPTGFEAAIGFVLQDLAQGASDATNTRVVVYRRLSDEAASIVADSGEDSAAMANDPVALRAFRGTTSAEGVVDRNGRRYGEIAYPFAVGSPASARVVLFSASLEDTLANVELVKRRVLIAGGVAMLVAALLGYGGASYFAARIRRLERAANRIAAGDLEHPVEVEGGDELAQLAGAFENMRQRLAQLETARREFIANASHELRTPIFSLGGFLELLADEELDEATRREFLTTMQEQVERLTRLATDLLDLSRMDAGRFAVEQAPLDLGDIAGAAAEEFAAVALSSGHPLEVVSADEPVRALGDAQRVLQIARILVENALLHTAPGTPVRVRVERRDGRAALVVEDEGEGIPPDARGHVFERFYRVDGGRASGSGLGLAIAQELARVMGGDIHLEADGKRTRFVLLLESAARVRERPPALV